MLAADHDTLPKPMREAVITCFDRNEAWLTRVFVQAEAEGSLRVDGPPREATPARVGGVEGAMLVVRLYDDVARFEVTANGLLASLASSAPARRK